MWAGPMQGLVAKKGFKTNEQGFFSYFQINNTITIVFIDLAPFWSPLFL